MTRASFVLAAALGFAIGAPASADVLDQTATINGMRVEYKVIRPRNFDPAKTYPAVLAFPPGDQSMDMVMVGIDYHYQGEAERRGYLVIEPAAPGGLSFVRGGDRIFPAFIEKILADYKIEGGKFNASGQSNGGRAAFKIAADYPQYFLSVTGLPGRLENATPEKLDALAKLCLHNFVGEDDDAWLGESRAQADALKARGAKITLHVEKGEGHVMSTVAYEGAARLFDQFDAARKGACAE
jgi:dipeptidyl aminopeptidase/acylaminoacyl peptidase